MVRNGRKYGVLTTVNGFAFLRRENHGALSITKLIPCTVHEPTVLKMLYYMSYLAANTPPLPETDNYGKTVAISAANYKYPTAAPQVTGPPFFPTSSVSQGSSYSGYSSSATFQYVLSETTEQIPELVVEPWISSNCLGGKTFRGQLLPDKSVVAKLWDSYTHNESERDNEVEAYMRLQRLWGVTIPKLVCSADFDFCWGIVLELVEVTA